MNSGDTYHSFAELTLQEKENQDWRRLLRRRPSAIAIIAPHGGGIEPGTSELAAAIAGKDHSLYCFEGVKQRGNQSLHITSGRFDDPACLELIRSSRLAVTVHGCMDRDELVYVGGLHAELRNLMIHSLSSIGFVAIEDATDHDGTDPGNICNQGSEGKGLQFELSLGVRTTMFAGLRASERRMTTERFAAFVTTIRSTLMAVL